MGRLPSCIKEVILNTFMPCLRKRELCHAEAQVIHATNEVAKANAAHKEAAGMEKWADDAVTRAKAALSTAVQENV